MDLSLVPIEDLIREAESRSRTFVCAYELPDISEQTGNFYTIYGKGSFLRATGMSSVLHNDCLNNWNGEMNKLHRMLDDDDDEWDCEDDD